MVATPGHTTALLTLLSRDTPWDYQSNFELILISDDPVPLLEPRQSLIAPCLVPGAYEAIVAYAEFSLQRCQ